MTSRGNTRKRSRIRSFEREQRIRTLLDAGLIGSANDIPPGAIPASPEFVRDCRTSLSMAKRAPYYQDIEFTCSDCNAPDVWTAMEQRHWFEQLHGPIYSDAKRCRICRRKRRGASEITNRKKGWWEDII